MTFLNVKIIRLAKSLDFVKRVNVSLVDKNVEILPNSDIRIYLNVYESNNTLYTEEIAHIIITTDTIYVLLEIIDIMNKDNTLPKWKYSHKYKNRIDGISGKQGYVAPDIRTIGFKDRTLNILKRNGIKKFNKLADTSKLMLQSFTGVGAVTYKEIIEILNKYDVYLD